MQFEICPCCGKPKRPSGVKSGRWPSNFTLQHDPGCQRVGVKKIGNRARKEGIPRLRRGFRDGHQGVSKQYGPANAPDSYGTETVADWRCTPTCPVYRLGRQSGERPSGGSGHTKDKVQGNCYGTYAQRIGEQQRPSTGTAARFFYQSDWSYEVAERLTLADPVRYVAKASSRERSEGLSGVVRLRSDLTEEQSQWVLAELQKAGVEPY